MPEEVGLVQVDPQSIIMWGLRVRMAIATGAVEGIKVICHQFCR